MNSRPQKISGHYVALGDNTKAEEYLAKSQEVCQKTGYTADALIMLPFLC